MLRALCPTLLALLSLHAAAADASPWRWPVPEREPARSFSVGPDRFAAGQHRGVDLGAPVGTPVRAVCAGPVRFAGTVGDAGLTISVRCGALVASYLHLGRAFVRRGTAVRPGAVLGTVGRSGRPRGGPHLHLGARRVADGRYVDPLTLLGGAGGPVAPPAVPAARGRPPALGPAPRPGLEPRRVRVPRPAPAQAPRPVAGTAPGGVPWAALAGLVLLVLAGAPTAAVRRRRAGRAGRVAGPAPARR